MNPFQGKAKSGEGAGNFEVPEADTHHGVLVAIIDLGTHTTKFAGEAKDRHEVFLVWELTNTKDSRGGSFFLSQRQTLSYHEKATLRKNLETWRRKKYAEGEEVNLLEALGKPWRLDVEHEEKVKDGKAKVYAKIKAVGPPMKGVAVGSPTVKPLFWYIGCPDPMPTHEALPWLPRVYGEKVDDAIRDSAEWARLRGESPRGNGQAAAVGAAGNDEAEIPF